MTIQSMNKGCDIAVFPRHKVATEMKNRTTWVLVRGRNKGGINDELGFFFLPQTTGRILAIFAEMRNPGQGRVRWKKSELNVGHVG